MDELQPMEIRYITVITGAVIKSKMERPMY